MARSAVARGADGGGGRGDFVDAHTDVAARARNAGGAAGGASSLKEAVRAETERVERELIQRALDETGGNVTQAARKLKISRKSLQTKMKDFGLRDREITKQGDQET